MRLETLLGVGLPGWGPELPRRPLGPESWEALVRLATRERVLPQLVESVRRGFPVSAEQAGQLDTLTQRAALAALTLEAAVADTVGRLDAAGIESRLLKGHATGHLVYPSPAWRHTGDVDVAVRLRDFAAAHAVVSTRAEQSCSRALGPRFETLEKAVTYRHPHGVEIDLHRWVSGEVGRYGVREEDLFARPTTVEIGGRRVSCPSHEVLLVHSALHLSSRQVRHTALVDFAWLAHAPALSAPEVVAVAGRGGSLPVLAWATRLVNRLVPLPLAFMDSMDGISLLVRERLVAGIVLDRPTLRVLIQVADRPRREWPGLVREVLWPSRAFLGATRRSRPGHLRHITRELVGAGLGHGTVDHWAPAQPQAPTRNGRELSTCSVS